MGTGYISVPVSRQEPAGVVEGVGADQEIGQATLCFPAAGEVSAIHLSGCHCTFTAGRNPGDLPVREESVQIAGQKRGRDLREHAFSDELWAKPAFGVRSVRAALSTRVETPKSVRISLFLRGLWGI